MAAMALLSLSKTAPHVPHPPNPISFHSSPLLLSFPFYPRLSPLKAAPAASSSSSDADHLLRKPLVSPVNRDLAGILDDNGDTHRNSSYAYNEVEVEVEEGEEEEDSTEEERWVDWEDQILEDTVPLVGFVRMLLHSGKYQSGDRLSAEHEKTIIEKLLPFHPEFEKKVGCGIDYITIGYHPNFQRSRCLFIARKDGELVDFSYWKCIKGLIRKNYPLYADGFILRHFRKRSRSL